MTQFMDALQTILQARRQNPTPQSYTARLLADENELCKKIGEEAIEVIIAAKGQGRERLIEESADLVYHLLVLLVGRQIGWAEVEAELEQRHRR